MPSVTFASHQSSTIYHVRHAEHARAGSSDMSGVFGFYGLFIVVFAFFVCHPFIWAWWMFALPCDIIMICLFGDALVLVLHFVFTYRCFVVIPYLALLFVVIGVVCFGVDYPELFVISCSACSAISRSRSET